MIRIKSPCTALRLYEDRSDQAVELIQGALIDIEDRKRELDNLDDILSSLDDTHRKLKQGFELSGNSR